MYKRILLIVSVALCATGTAAQAQSATAAVTISIAPVLVISSSGAFSFPVAGDAHYTAGYIESTSGPTLTHRANVPYKITVAAQSGSTLGFTNYTGRVDADPNKPVSSLSMLSTIGGTPVNAVVGDAGAGNDLYTRATRGGNLSSALTARLALDYANDPPGTYSTTVVFTMVAQ
jgi:hypothetical protein